MTRVRGFAFKCLNAGGVWMRGVPTVSRSVDGSPVVGLSGARVAYRRTLAAATFGLVVTLVVALSPTLRFAYRSHDGRLAVETVAALVAALVAVLFYGRFRRSGSLQSLLLVFAMGLLGGAALVLVVLPIVGGAAAGSPVTTWAALVVRLLAGLLLLAAASLPTRVVSPHHVVRDTVAALGLLVVAVGLVQVLAAKLPTAVDVHVPPEASAVPSFDAHPFVLAVQASILLCFAVTAVAFTRQAARTGDDLAGWVGAAAAVGAWSRVNYLLFPSLYSDWFYTGDLLRLGFYLLLLVGAWREVHDYWAAQAETAVFAERRRLARELHDGALQEIGYIRSQVDAVDGPAAERIRSASDRAIDETRAALAALTAPGDAPFLALLRRAVEQVADRYDVAVIWNVRASSLAAPRHSEDLLRIAREAVTNAARHGGAGTIHVTVTDDALEVADDGSGFDVDAPARPGSFGIVSMRERAAAMGGRLAIRSGSGEGTKVRVTWPTTTA
jgi:signal transduction histidine kinase